MGKVHKLHVIEGGKSLSVVDRLVELESTFPHLLRQECSSLVLIYRDLDGNPTVIAHGLNSHWEWLHLLEDGKVLTLREIISQEEGGQR